MPSQAASRATAAADRDQETWSGSWPGRCWEEENNRMVVVVDTGAAMEALETLLVSLRARCWEAGSRATLGHLQATAGARGTAAVLGAMGQVAWEV